MTYTEKSKEGKIFKRFIQHNSEEENIQLAYRNIKRNRGSHTAGTNHRTLEYWEDVPMEKFIILYTKQTTILYSTKSTTCRNT